MLLLIKKSNQRYSSRYGVMRNKRGHQRERIATLLSLWHCLLWM